MPSYTSYGPGDAITWGSPVGHPLDPRVDWAVGDEAEEYCPATCPELHGLECYRHSTDLEADALGALRCGLCYSARLSGLVS